MSSSSLQFNPGEREVDKKLQCQVVSTLTVVYTGEEQDKMSRKVFIEGAKLNEEELVTR